MIVAHPDDETIWVGGTLLRNKKKWDTSVVCLCRASDKDRSIRFKKACKILGVRGFIYNLDDKKFYPLSNKEILNKVLRHVKNSYDILFTHGKNGEYGHIRHKEIHEAIKYALEKKLIIAEKIFFFSYLNIKNNFQGYSLPNKNANSLIKLNKKELLLKKHIITEVYGFQKDGFEEKSSGKIEAFNELRK